MSTTARFHSVVVRDGWGRFDGDGFHRAEAGRGNVPGGITFSICSISQEIAAVFDQQLSATTRSEMAARKPDWLDVIIHAELASATDAAVAVIDADFIHPQDPDPARCAVAVACVAFDLGLFEVVPERYLVRLGERSVSVRMDFDDDSESWFGDATVAAAKLDGELPAERPLGRTDIDSE